MNYYYTDPSKGIDHVVGPVTLEGLQTAYIEDVISEKASVAAGGTEKWEQLLDVLNRASAGEQYSPPEPTISFEEWKERAIKKNATLGYLPKSELLEKYQQEFGFSALHQSPHMIHQKILEELKTLNSQFFWFKFSIGVLIFVYMIFGIIG